MDPIDSMNYISCPSCLTFFKPKANSKLTPGTCKCVCCGHLFNLDSIKTASQPNQPNQHHSSNNLKYQAVVNKPNYSTRSKPNAASKVIDNQLYVQPKRTSPNVATSSYLKTYKLKSRMLLILWILMPLFFLDLLTSAILEYKDDLAQNDKWRGYIQQLCNITNCKLPTYKNLNYILIEDNALVSDETQKNTVQLHAMLNNIAKYDQKYPSLKIHFSDINGNFISEKKITPEQYLKNTDLEQDPYLPKNSKQYISITLDDPGPSAVNYEIDLTS